MPLTRIRTDDLLSGSVSDGTLNATAITGQSAATTADDNDLILIYDDGASALRKMTRANFTSGITGDITAVTAGNGLSGGGNSGDVTLALDLNELSSADVAVASDSIAIIDANDSNTSKKESIADVVTAIAGSGLAGSSGVLNLDVNELSALGAQAATSDFLVMEDATDNSTKKVLVSNLPIDTTLSGAYTGGRFITASNGPIEVQRTSNTNAATELLRLAVSGSVNGTDAGPRLSFHVPYADESRVGATIDGIKSLTSENDSTTDLRFSTSDNNEILDHQVTISSDGLAVAGRGVTVPLIGNAASAFHVATSGITDALVVKNSNGYVGLGDTSPDHNLHISSTGDASIFIEADTDNVTEGDNAFIKLSQDNTAVQSIIGLVGFNNRDPEGVTYTDALANNFLLGTTTNYGLQLGTNDNVRITVQNDGFVGVGQNSPSYPLTLEFSNNGGYVSRFYNSYNGAAGGLWIKAGNTTSTSSPQPFIVQSYNGTNQFYVRQDGAYFHRAGAISTEDSKRDVSEMSESAVDLLRDIRIVTYNYHEDTADRVKRIGFIADDTTNQPAIDARLTNGGAGFDIQTLVGTLIKAVQELNSRISTLENGD